MSEAEEKLKHEGWSDIREKKRGCTDCLFLVLLSVFIEFIKVLIVNGALLLLCS
jgi:hypothetical protein